MADIFRKSALEKLSSPDQLDRMIVITSPLSWIAIAGGFVIVIATVIWGVFGKLPQNVETSGIIISGDGTGITYSEVSGVIESVLVEPGQFVEKGQVIAHIDAGDVNEDITKLSERIAAVEAVTLESLNDVVTSDNKPLLDVKSELVPLRNTYEQVKRNYDVNARELSAQKEVVSLAEADMNAKRDAYYATISDQSGAAEQAIYSQAQSEYGSAQSYAESAFSNKANAGTSISQAKQEEERTEGNLTNAKARRDESKTKYDAAQAALAAASNAYEEYKQHLDEQTAAGAGTGGGTGGTGGSGAATETYTQEELDALLVVVKEKQEAVSVAYSEYEAAEATVTQYREAYNATADAREEAEMAYENASSLYNKYSDKYEEAQNDYFISRQRYIDFQNKQAELNKAASIANNEYNWATNTYSTEKNRLDNLKQNSISLKAELDTAKEQMDIKQESIQIAFDSTKESVLSSMKLELSKLTTNLKKMEIISAQTGIIQEVIITNGAVVNQGSEVTKVLQGDATKEEVVCYVPVSDGKKISVGMEVMLYPTTVNKQEYGHMSGIVKSVDDYVTSSGQINKKLGDVSLAETFLKSGPVVEVVCEIKEDKDTASGYYWSSKKGAEVVLVEGTLFTANIVTEEKAPITLLIPYLKDKLTVKPIQTAAN